MKVNVQQSKKKLTLHWLHNEHDGVSDHQRVDCLLNRLFISGPDQSKLVNSPHKGPVTRKMFPFDDVIMINLYHGYYCSWLPTIWAMASSVIMIIFSLYIVYSYIDNIKWLHQHRFMIDKYPRMMFYGKQLNQRWIVIKKASTKNEYFFIMCLCSLKKFFLAQGSNFDIYERRYM